MICPVMSGPKDHEKVFCLKAKCAWCVEIATSGHDSPRLVCAKVVEAMAATEFYVGIPGDADKDV